MHLPLYPLFLPLASLCQELRAHIPHALLAQPEKYGTVTATVLPDWTGTLMRRLTALIQAASTATSDVFFLFIWKTPRLCAPICVFVLLCSMYLFVRDLNVLRLCVGGETCRARTIKERSHCSVKSFSLVVREL